MLLRFDGASRGNPGPGGSAAVLYGADGTISSYCYKYHGAPVTNNVAEYVGLVIGLKMALAAGLLELVVEGDSKLVIEQVFGNWKCRHPNILPLFEEALALKKQFETIDGRWIPRAKNVDADRFSNEAYEKRADCDAAHK